MAMPEVRMDFDLVDRRHHSCLGDDPLKMSWLEIRHADRACSPRVDKLSHRAPRRDIVPAVKRRKGPVHQEQIKLVNIQVGESLRERRPHIVRAVVCVPQLARDVDV